MDCIVLIRRFIRPEREQDYLAWIKGKPLLDMPGYKGKTITRLEAIADLPPGLNSFHVAGNPDCVTYLSMERWNSVEEFRQYMPDASTNDQDQFEVRPRQRVILSVAFTDL